MPHLFRFSGEHWGFTDGEALRDRDDRFRGWFDGKKAFDKDGEYIGDVTDDGYVVRSPRTPPTLSRRRVIGQDVVTREMLGPREPRISHDGVVDGLGSL